MINPFFKVTPKKKITGVALAQLCPLKLLSASIPEVMMIKSIQDRKGKGVSWWNLMGASLKKEVFKHLT